MREIRQDLPVFLRRVRDGESLTVTDHGAPVALLTPVPAAGDDPLGDVIAAGRVLPGSGEAATPTACCRQPATWACRSSVRLRDQQVVQSPVLERGVHGTLRRPA